MFAKIVAGVVLGLTALLVGIALGTPGGAERVRETVLAVGIYLSLIVPAVVIANRRDPN